MGAVLQGVLQPYRCVLPWDACVMPTSSNVYFIAFPAGSGNTQLAAASDELGGQKELLKESKAHLKELKRQSTGDK